MGEKFFFGGVTSNGFYTSLAELIGGKEYFTYIIKGGPGMGKSSIMKKITDQYEQKESVTRYYCSSDPDSLDAVVLNSSKVIVVDGTPPHTFDPTFPGVCQKIIDFSQCCDESVISDFKEEIIESIEKNKAIMKKALELNKSLGAMCLDRLYLAEKYANKKMISDSVNELWNQLKAGNLDGTGKQSIRQLSVMTRYGYLTQMETVENYRDVFVLKDDMFYASNMWLDILASKAVEAGYDVKMSPSLLLGTTVREHLLIDELDVAIICSNPLTKISYSGGNVISCDGFYDEALKNDNEAFLYKNDSSIEELSANAAKMLDAAKISHDEVEAYYIKAMDFDALNKMCHNVIKAWSSAK